jgi:hypothetical protein
MVPNTLISMSAKPSKMLQSSRRPIASVMKRPMAAVWLSLATQESIQKESAEHVLLSSNFMSKIVPAT